MHRIRISMLGTFTVEMGGQAVTQFHYEKVRALLAYLVAEPGHPHRRNHLTNLLWPDVPARNARQNLSQALSTLRTVLGDRAAQTAPAGANGASPGRIIEVTRQSVCIHTRSDLWVDVQAFDNHLRSVRDHPHERLSDCEACLDHLHGAVELYRGGFLKDLSLSDSAPYEEWALLRREQCRRKASEALDMLGDASLDLGDYPTVCRYARRQLAMDPWHELAHRRLMYALALDGQRNAALAQYEACREILAADLDVEPEAATMELCTAIRNGDLVTHRTTLPQRQTSQGPGTSPFKGLRFFDVNDADLFFGRETLTDRLVRRVVSGEPFLAVIGASGSGKSSLLRAGLIATLQRGVMVGSRPLQIKLLTPSLDPLQALCRSVMGTDAAAPLVAACRAEMLTDASALQTRLNSGLLEPQHAADGSRVLLVIDQFEELFTLCRDPATRRAFVDNLVTAATAEPSADVERSTQVVIALRADFYHHCADYGALRELLETRQAYIGAMTAQEMRRAIQGPANKNGWTFEPGLVDLLLRDVGADAQRTPEPGALPLLSHALLETWKRRQGRTLTLQGYADAGGVRGAIAQSAESVYRALGRSEQATARHVFLRLTELGQADGAENRPVTRRRASLEEIISLPNAPGTVQRVLNALATARLITVGKDAVEVAHEALIREWPALQMWLQEDLEGLRIHRRLTDAGHSWETGGRDPGELFRGARLAQAEVWIQEAERALTPLERAFFETSLAEQRRREETREAQQQRELEAAQRLAEAQQRRAAERGRLLRWLSLAAGLLLIAAVAAALLGSGYRAASLESAALADINAAAAAENAAVAATAQTAEAMAVAAREQEAAQRSAAERAQQQEAVQRAAAESAREEALLHAQIAESNLLAVRSGRLRDEDYALALLLSAEAYDMWDSPQSRSSMLSALEAYPGLSGLVHHHADYQILSLAFSPDGSHLAATSRDELYFWDMDTLQPLGDPWQNPSFRGDLETFRTLDYSPDGAVVASGGCGEFDANDDCLSGEITLWDADTGQMLNQLRGHTYTIRGLAYDPTGTRLASCGDETVLLWDVEDVARASIKYELEEHTTPVAAVAFSPDGTLLASVGVDFEATSERAVEAQDYVRLWDVETGALVQRLSYQGYGFASLAFSSDGTVLAAGSCNRWSAVGCDQGLIRRWNIIEGEEILPPIVQHSNVVHSVHFISDNTVMLSVPWDKSIGLWDVSANAPLAEPVTAVESTGLSAVSPDGQILASARGSTVFLWDTAVLQSPSRTRLATVLTSYAPSRLFSLDMSPDGSLLAAGSVDGQIHLWETADGAPAGDPLAGHMGPAVCVAFSPDGRTLASGGMDATIRLWAVESGESIRPPLQGHTQTVTGVAFSPDGTLLASSSDDTTVRLWDAATGELLSVNQGMSVPPIPKLGAWDMNLWDVAFSPDGSMLAAAVAIPERVAVLWEISDPTAPRLLARLPTNAEGGVTQVAFSPAGSLLAASVGLEGKVLLWDLETYQPAAAPIAAHESGSAWPLAFSPDGRTLASGGLNSTLRLIDVATGNPIGPALRLHTRPEYATPSGLVYSPDGKSLYSSSMDGALRRWDVDPDSWRDQICELAGRNLTQEEWLQHLPGEPYRATCEQWSMDS